MIPEPKIYISVPTDNNLDPRQLRIKKRILNSISQARFEPQEFGVSGLPSKISWNFEAALKIMEECQGAVILAFARWRFTVGAEIISMPTEYNHFEGALAISQDIPTLIIAEEEVVRRGIVWPFGRHLIVYIPSGADEEWLGTKEFRSQFDSWCKSVKTRHHIPDVHEAAEKAIISSSSATSQKGNISVGAKGVAVSSDETETTVPYDKAFELIGNSTMFVLNQLKLSHKQTREQAQAWFRFSLIAAGVGFLLIGIGVIAVIFGQVTTGLATAISSVIPNAVGALFFVQLKATNERVDAIRAKLIQARELQTAFEIANTISDPQSQDNLKAEIVRRALWLEPNPKSMDKKR